MVSPSRRPRQVLGLVAATAAVALIPLASASSAAAACELYHCYARAKWAPSTDKYGAVAYISTSSLSTPAPSSTFVSSELWVGTSSGNPPNYWIETGAFHGTVYLCNNTNRRWLWWEVSWEHTACHETSLPVDLGTIYSAKINYYQSNAWYIYRNGGWIGTSVNNPPPSRYMATGAESGTSSGSILGSSGELQKRNDNGLWSYIWSGATLEGSAWTSVAWIDPEDSVAYAQ